MYDIILGNNWIEEVSHHIDRQRNILWLGQTDSGGRFKYLLDGLRRNKVG
jgi:hypothetical protein